MTITCARCERAADPDTECVVVILGVPMCAACAAEKADEREGRHCHQFGVTMIATRHKISATRSGSHPSVGDWDADYQITFTYRPGEEPVFVSISPDAGDHGAFTDLAQADLIDWAKNWLDENADRATDKAETERAAMVSP